MDENDPQLEFEAAPRSELERTVEQLVEIAQRVLETQSRLRNLMQANRSVVEQLELNQVLRTIAEAAVSLVGSRYGALGVISPDGLLERFIHVGMPQADADAIGHLPEGHGILGAVIESAAPIRLEHLGADPRSVGFPEHHPPMDGFLGVPIRVRGEVYGNLYLTDRIEGAFTEEDEELVGALAATAGVAIDNARLFDEVRRRERWSAALAEISSVLFSGEIDDALGVVVDKVASFLGVHLVCLVVPVGGGNLRVEHARGADADMVLGRVYPEQGTLVGRALENLQPTLSDGQAAGHRFPWQPEVGPSVAIPLTSTSGARFGALTLSRAVGGARFADSDLEMASSFATQAGLAIELTQARRDRIRSERDRRQLELAEDRNRTARDLHDHVIQRLFAAGLALQVVETVAPDSLKPRIGEQVDAIDEAIAQIRTAIFTLQGRPARSALLRHRVLDLVEEVAPSLSGPPTLTFTGPVDLVTDEDLIADVEAVIRESVSNVARHADATTCAISITLAGSQVEVQVVDDGVGIPDARDRSSGLSNLRERAAARGGRFSVAAGPERGTRLLWAAPVDEGES